MNNDPYLGIKKPIALYSPQKITIDSDRYISIQLYQKKGIKFYEVFFCNNEKQIFLGKYYKSDEIFEVSYRQGKILIHNDKFILEKGKVQIIEVLALYDVCDEIFYYCTEEEAIKLFDETIDSTSLKRKEKKLLRTNDEKQSLYSDSSSNEDDKTDVGTNTPNLGETNIIKFRR